MNAASNEKKRVALLGAGYISDHHLKALEAVPSAQPVAICDIRLEAAKASQARAGLAFACDDVDELIAQAAPDVVHILTPPPSHATLASRLLRQGVDVLIEKPVSLDLQSVDELAEAEVAGGARFGINHNATYYPAFQKLLRRVASGRIGPIQHVSVLVNTPMRQIAAKQFGHWMFAEPGNIVFESLYHPFSQLHALLGTLEHLHAEPLGYRQFTPELEFFDTWLINASFAAGTASLHYGFTGDNPVWRVTVMGQDGVAEADIFSGSFRITGRSRHPWYVDTLLWNSRHAAGGVAHGIDAMAEFVLSTLKLKHGGEPFVHSNRDSLSAFYEALASGKALPVGLPEGREVVRCCEATRAQLPVTQLRSTTTAPAPAASSTTPVDALVLGASGFLGRHLVERLLADGVTVRAMLRRPDLAPQWLRDERIELLQGELNDPVALRTATRNVATVYHLAAAASDSWEATRQVIVEGTAQVAEACVEAGVRCLVYTSTIAACYLADAGTLNEQTPVDPKPAGRSFYARAKIESEHLLRQFNGREGLRVRILRPGVVVGSGGIPRHSAVGEWVNPGNVIAWGYGRHPMPLVLASDCADALVAAATHEGDELHTFNLVGDVRPSAREYVAQLREASGRAINFHARPIVMWYFIDIVKWMVKVLIRRPNADFPSWRDLATRLQRRQFDCTAAKTQLGWQPEADAAAFGVRGLDSMFEASPKAIAATDAPALREAPPDGAARREQRV